MTRFLLALALWLCAAAVAEAQDVIYLHVVRQGETLASIAQTYYGDPKRENYDRKDGWRCRVAHGDLLCKRAIPMVPIVTGCSRRDIGGSRNIPMLI